MSSKVNTSIVHEKRAQATGAAEEVVEEIGEGIQHQADTLRSQLHSGIEQVNRAIDQNEAAAQVRDRVEMMAAEQGISFRDVKRWAAMIGGGLLAFQGLRKSVGGLSVAGIGAAIVYWGMSGESPLALLNRRRSTTHRDAESRIRNGELNLNGAMTGIPKQVTRSIIVKAGVDDAYSLWSNFENFPQFMQHIKAVYKAGDDLSHWVMEGPLGARLEWDARTTRLDPNKRIGWQSIDGAIKTSGQVTFNSLPNEQTEVTVTMQYVPPAGLAGEVVAELFGNPEG
ncbi:MAG: SRPBCC family protein, partial [Caldilineaceae bacterium]|nr:SRPBCC family protein [Caldilineaceae bacterium]